MSLIPQEKLDKKIFEIAEKHTIRDDNGNFITLNYLKMSHDLITWYNTQIVEEIEAMKGKDVYNDSRKLAYRQALSDIISKLQDTLTNNNHE